MRTANLGQAMSHLAFETQYYFINMFNLTNTEVLNMVLYSI